MGKASDWLREERRNVLGHWCAFCLELRRRAPLVRRLRGRGARDVPACGGVMLRRCPACSAPFSSMFAVDCEECGEKLREPELLGMRIRRPAR